MVLVDHLAPKCLVREVWNRSDTLAQFSEPSMKILGCWSSRRADGLAPDQLGQRLFDNLPGLAVRRASELLAKRLLGLRCQRHLHVNQYNLGRSPH